jgi:hypothetical protein
VDDLDAFEKRLIPEAAPARAAVLFLPNLMTGRPVDEAEARRAYASETPIWDRETVWDVTETHLAIANVMRKQWAEVDANLAVLDEVAACGAPFAAALASSVREELGAARGGPEPKHDDLRRLGYRGISELLSYRVA